VNEKPFQRKASFFYHVMSNEQGVMALLAALIGIAAGFGAIGFRFLIDSIQALGYGAGRISRRLRKPCPGP
jgi:hypothetical protein